MTDVEAQDEEREVLLSIYEGDVAFKQLTPTTYQYKYGKDSDPRSFLLEMSWGENYPTEKPKISMDTFYNKHILQSVKNKIIAHIEAEAEQWLGCAMTYTLLQSVQENFIQLTEDQPDSIVGLNTQASKLTIGDNLPQETAKKPKKEILTKAQKRRQWNKTDGNGEKSRGWNWIDVIKHLSQTSSKLEPET